MRIIELLFAAVVAALYAPATCAFQIAPLGSKFEARLTNEKEPRLARVAGKLGVLIKLPVHEEITQLGFGCPAVRDKLGADDSCKGGDLPFANPFIVYGVRWNDLPPFRLSPGQGRCQLFGVSVCQVEQTIRFSTQPDCWYCLFREAGKKAVLKKITGCEKGAEFAQGNLMTRSHFGDLQFLHAMERDEGVPAEVTRRKILDWLQFAWRVFAGEIGPDAFLKDIEIPTLKEHFSCSALTVSDIYILGRNDILRPRLSDIAFGSILHTVQDSFAAGHVTRELPVKETCSTDSRMPRPGRIVEFHAYPMQDAREHDKEDSREAMADAARNRWPEAVEVTSRLFQLYNEKASWDKARPYLECVFELSPNSRPASTGSVFRKRVP